MYIYKWEYMEGQMPFRYEVLVCNQERDCGQMNLDYGQMNLDYGQMLSSQINRAFVTMIK